MKKLFLVLLALLTLAGSGNVNALPVDFGQKFYTGKTWEPFAPQFSKRAQMAPVNTVAPVASGTNEVGETLSCTTGTWTGTTPLTYAYQWRRDAANIGSATNSTYVLVSADAETDVDCVVTASNKRGSATADSNDIAIAAAGDGSLADVLASTVFDLDATKSASYSGSGTTWSNLVTAPADGSAQTAYDFLTGDGATSTTYPTFNGSAGSAAAYWTFDGGDDFRLKSGANTSFLNAIHKTTGGSDWWFAATLKFKAGTTIQGLFANRTVTATSVGAAVWVEANEALRSAQRGDAAQVIATRTGALVDNTAYIIIVSHSHSTNTTRIWVNSSTAEEIAHTYDATTSNGAQVTRLLGIQGSAGNGPLNSGTEAYSAAAGNEYLDNTKAGLLMSALCTRHNRNYTGSCL